jgi:integrase
MEMNTLTPADVRKLPDGKHADGKYLYLVVRGDSRSWVVRGPRNAAGKRLERGLGSVDLVSLAIARRKRDELLAAWQEGRDPLEERRQAAAAAAKRKTFGEVGAAVIETRRSSWRTSFEGRRSTLDQWTKDVEVDCKPIAAKFVDEITIDDIKAIVAPYWDRNHLERARALLGRIELVIDYAIAHGWRATDNPASWKRFVHLSPKAPRAADPHFAAVAFTEAPAIMRKLRASDCVSARIVEFIMLTAVRSGEARGALWSEIDFDRKVWTVPGSRMKKGLEHEVPLSDAAIALLRRMPRADELVFIGGRGDEQRATGKPMSNASVWDFVQRLGVEADLTTHGFRATFKGWCDHAGVDEKLSERCLAHEIGGETQQAYGGRARHQLTERRREVMAAWAAFLDGNVVPFRKVA